MFASSSTGNVWSGTGKLSHFTPDMCTILNPQVTTESNNNTYPFMVHSAGIFNSGALMQFIHPSLQRTFSSFCA
jgi:hypothetical protein